MATNEPERVKSTWQIRCGRGGYVGSGRACIGTGPNCPIDRPYTQCGYRVWELKTEKVKAEDASGCR